MWRFAVFVLLSGCGLVLDVAPEPHGRADGAASDVGTPDVTVLEAGMPDGGRSDAMAGGDGGVTDGSPTDAPAPALPTVSKVTFENGLVTLEGPSGAEADQPLPARVDAVNLEFSTTMEHRLIEASIRGSSGSLGGTPVLSDAGGRTHLTLQVEGEPLADGYYCLQVRSSPSTAGILLDGEWRTTFPSGDMSPGGNFAYGFSVLQGDLNGDRSVDGADYLLLQTLLGTTTPQGDLDGSGWVDMEDYDLWNESFGNTLSPSVSLLCDVVGP